MALLQASVCQELAIAQTTKKRRSCLWVPVCAALVKVDGLGRRLADGIGHQQPAPACGQGAAGCDWRLLRVLQSERGVRLGLASQTGWWLAGAHHHGCFDLWRVALLLCSRGCQAQGLRAGSDAASFSAIKARCHLATKTHTQHNQQNPTQQKRGMGCISGAMALWHVRMPCVFGIRGQVKESTHTAGPPLTPPTCPGIYHKQQAAEQPPARSHKPRRHTHHAHPASHFAGARPLLRGRLHDLGAQGQALPSPHLHRAVPLSARHTNGS